MRTDDHRARANDPSFLTTLSRLRTVFTVPEQRGASVLLGLMLIGAVFEMVGVGAIPAFVALLDNPERALGHLAERGWIDSPPPSSANVVLWAAGAIVVLFLVKNAFLAVLTFLQARYITNRQADVARRLFRAYLAAPYSFHLKRNSAELLRNANVEAVESVGAVLIPILQLAREALTAFAIILLLVIAEPFVSLFSFVILGAASLVFFRTIRKRLDRHGREIQHQRTGMIQTVTEGLGGIKLTKLLGREGYFVDRYRIQAERFAEATRFRALVLASPQLFLETVGLAGLLGVAALLHWQGRPTDEVLPILALLAVAVVRMIPSFIRMTNAVTMLQYGRHSLNVIYEDLTQLSPGCAPRPAGASRVRPLSRAVQLQAVTYHYPDAAAPSISDVSLTIERGSAVAFVGTTGAGKSTVVDLILGLVEPTTGRVLVDGQDIRADLRGWQDQVGYVPQDLYLTDDTIRRNVALGLPDHAIDEEAVQLAIGAAQLRELVDALPAGLDTVVGERGLRLSGGQRQRIGIARALYHRPQLLVLDEATSALDHETEREVMQAVERLRGDRTIILIAHRLTAVRACETLFLLEGGRLVDSGPFEEIVRSRRELQAYVPAR